MSSFIIFIKPHSDLVVSAMERDQNFMGVIVPMIDNMTAQERADASFRKKTIQLVEGQKAWAEYEANAVLVREKTARLRALRLTREAVGKAPLKRRTAA